jgi:hypothetical protein
MQVTRGNYLLSVKDAIDMAALQLVTVLAGVDVGTVNSEGLAKQISTFLCAQSIMDAVTQGMTPMSLVVRYRVTVGCCCCSGWVAGCGLGPAPSLSCGPPLRVPRPLLFAQEAVLDRWLDLRGNPVLLAQRQYITFVKGLPEYGATFFVAEVLFGRPLLCSP